MQKVTSFFILSGLLILGACSPPEPDLLSGKIIDLSYAYDDTTIFWPTAKEFELEVVHAGMTDAGYYYAANNFCTAEHGGTHIDAPIHFSENGKTVDAIPVDRLIGKGVVIDVSEKCTENRDYRAQVEDFTAWEEEHGGQLNDVIILLRTGFGKYWPDREQYMGTDERGEQAVPKLHFPGLHPEAAKWLAENRSVKAIGLDTPSIDYGQSRLFESHVTLFEHNIPAFENIANLDQLPEKDFTVIALPMKIKGGSGGPLRIVAVVKE
ncbi:cyclase family protein [candidate division KSB1 bacterium]|nr:cyclase family protein [candidate division KSB1 bacterium]NIR69485.1 cyclase family protein [candidate division KSB1 bacterium]NIS22835.1 cyclase family protein [candidate division KSB1 bacterium]NIT69674.1 cyclase family protein [candidate division KSB1 bacterium]NIU23344.1 cyclase family protein [candidate division KSB1 bacterium]